MVAGARSFVRTEDPNLPVDPATILRELRPLFYDTEKTMMLFSDAKQGLQDVVEALKSSS